MRQKVRRRYSKFFGGQAFRLPGVITVWLALTLTLFLAVTGVLLDFARAQSVSYRLAAACTSACESVFAGYSKALLGEYHLLARYIDSEDGLEEETLYYLRPERSGHRKYGDLTGFHVDLAEWSERVYMTDENGAVFRKMASDAMLDTAGGILVPSWKRRLGLDDRETTGAVEESAGKDSFRIKDVFENYDEIMDVQEEKKEEDGDSRTEEQEDREDSAVAENVPEEGRKILDRLVHVKEALSRGLTGLLIPEGAVISAAAVPAKSLPSSLSPGKKGRRVRASGGDGDPILFREYLMRNMACYTTGRGAVPAYEAEYLIAGKKSDDRNLRSVLIRLFLMRFQTNTMTIMKDRTMRSAAMEAAAVCTGWTGDPAVIAGMTGLLVCGWAAAESVCDVRSLLSDGRVPLVKGPGDWKLAFSVFDTALTGDPGVQDTADGLSYGDHLRILLYFADDSVLSYRAMDVIDWNVGRAAPGFSCSRCMLEGRLTVNGGGRLMFPHMYRHVSGGGGSSDFTKTASFSLLGEGSG